MSALGAFIKLPASAKACLILGCLSTIASVSVLCLYGTGGVVGETNAVETRQFYTAAMMLIPAMMLEGCYLISSRSSLFGVELSGTEMSCFILVEYSVKMICYASMAQFGGGVVHVHSRARDTRGCYTFRYLQWAVAVPTYIALNNSSLWSRSGRRTMAQRLWPNLLATVSYIFGNWVAQVTPFAPAGYALIVVTCCAYLSTAYDQVRIVMATDRGVSGFKFKAGSIMMKEVVFVVYAAMNLMGIFGLVSSETEQFFFSLGDVLLKVVQGSILVIVRNWESLSELSDGLQRRVEAGREDMSRLFRHASAPIFAMTPAGVVLAWNEHLAGASGVAERAAIGNSIFDLVREESCASLRAAIQSCSMGVSSGSVDVLLKHSAKDDQPVHMLLTLIAQRCSGTDGGVCGEAAFTQITAIGQDMTEVMAMKQMQLRKEQITAVLGHELRSPLHGIVGLSGSMAEGTSNKMQKRQLTMIKGCAARLLDLVTNIMEMAHSEKAKAQVVEKRHVNMMDIVDEVVGITEAAVDKNGRRLVGTNVMIMNGMCTGKLPMVFGDSYKITQLLYNLVTNAAKFTTSGSISLSAREDEAGSMLEIDVADTGKGIHPEALANIFEPFSQVENKDARSFQGIGLGLSVADTIAKAHGGSIRVASKLGEGSTFTFRVPCDFERRAGPTHRSEDGGVEANSRAAKQIAAQSQATPPGGVEPPMGQRPLLLSVDDDDINQEVIEQSLASEYRIVRAMNGLEAFDYLDSGKEFPSMVLLDVMMPGPSGFEVVAEIRNKRNLCHSQLPVVMLSARSPQEATAIEAFRSGATDYMQKPFCSDVLKHRLSVMQEVRREMRKAQVLAVEHYKGELQRQPPLEQDAAGGMAASVAKNLAEERDKFQARLKEEEQAARAARGERDEFQRRFEALQQQAAAEARSLADERDGLRSELAAMSAPHSKLLADGTLTSSFMSSCTYVQEPHRDDRDAQAVDFYRGEVRILEEKLVDVQRKAAGNKSTAWVATQRAEALNRELQFVRQLGRVRRLAS